MIDNPYWKVSKESLKIGQAITAGILLEIACEPSPGLVSPNSTGAHDDMNIMTFLLSSSVISQYFSIFAQYGIDWDGSSPLLETIRPLGLEAEKEFFRITNSVNTQKGALFLGGIIAAAAGSIKNTQPITVDHLCERVSTICNGIVNKELKNLKIHDKISNGEKLYISHNYSGIRGEVEKGLPSIRNIGYPIFKESIDNGLSLNDSMIQTLIHLFAYVDDTTVVSRLGLDGIFVCRRTSLEVIEKGGMKTPSGRKSIADLNDYFIENNISPGGCADLLAMVLAVYFLEGNQLDTKTVIS